MFCPNCGTKNDDTATTCTKCGFKLAGPAGAFRGTMMLNSEQSVQGMVDEHRRKLEEAAAARQSAEGPDGASPAPPAVALQGSAKIAAAGSPKRRMGTMLGVAPQMGGVKPPDFFGGPTPPLPSAVAPVPDAAAASAPDPLGGTVAFAAVPPPAAAAGGPAPAATPASPLAAGRTEAFAIPAVTPAAASPVAASPLAAGKTEAFAAVPAASPDASPLAAGRTEAFAATPEPTPGPPAAAQRGRTEAFDATPPPIERPAMEQPTPAGLSSADSYTPAGVPRRLKPLDVFLIVITFGLYALWLRARPRR